MGKRRGGAGSSSLIVQQGSRVHKLRSGDTGAWLPQEMWDFPGAGIEPVS